MMGAQQLDGWIDGGLEDGELEERRPAKVLGRAPRFPEVLSVPAALIAELPLPPSLGLHVPGIPGLVRVELDPAEADASRREGALVLDREEWRALVVGAEADRLWPDDLVTLCRRKIREPGFRIDPEVALAGAQPDLRESWSVGRVLARVAAEPRSIELEARG